MPHGVSNIQLGDALCVSIAGEKEQHVGTDRWRRPAKTFCFSSGLPSPVPVFKSLHGRQTLNTNSL